MEALGVLPDFASALKNRGWAKSDSCGIALAGPPAPGGGRVSVLARRLFLSRFSRYGVFPRARPVVLNTHSSLPIFGRKLQKIDETDASLPRWAKSDVFSKRRK